MAYVLPQPLTVQFTGAFFPRLVEATTNVSSNSFLKKSQPTISTHQIQLKKSLVIRIVFTVLVLRRLSRKLVRED